MRHRDPPRDPDAEPAPDDIFADFVRRANTEWVASVEALLTEPDPTTHEVDSDEVVALDELTDEHEPATSDRGTDRIVLLTNQKSQPPPEPERDPEQTVRRSEAEILASAGPRARRKRARAWRSAVQERSETTQRVEAARVVPDVASVPPPPQLPQEGSEDGQIPAGELDRKLADMDVLLRYGHAAQVGAELESLRLVYPRDLLLLRRIAELYVAHEMRGAALEALFALAHALFERRNVEGMKQALEQVRVLDPDNGRAARLLALLARRPESQPPSRR
ncbi:hypothetical protein [Sandaracinus amylolyticus]|uniref:Tetratricopeptide repeat protein n=1 Tax=Sandaracinus amylolyticus TaxID=927083 RepID=A0A0F6W3R1_9BACT|nr:hypothetical protein [Sandaracinus amylolyticus]AKF06552.1 hypothetical protein DB32_003701 [Sandaracinus amylolyticus]